MTDVNIQRARDKQPAERRALRLRSGRAIGRLAWAAAYAGLVLLACLPVRGEVVTSNSPGRTAVSPLVLDKAIAGVISHPEYAWRLPREKAESSRSEFWSAFWNGIGESIRDFVDFIVRLLRKLLDWIKDLFPEQERTAPSNLNWLTPVQAFLFSAMAIAAGLLGLLLYRLWKRRQSGRLNVQTAVAVAPVPTLAEDVTADQRPANEWMDLARQFMNDGEWRLAVRAMFLACLAELAHRGHLTIAKYKSNREYIREIERKAYDHPDLLEAFAQNTRILERVWYGDHVASPETFRAFSDNQDVILREE